MNVSTDKGPGNIKNIIRHGQILRSPHRQPQESEHPCRYAIGTEILQLDEQTCLLISFMEEHGGPDLCVGSDGFIFRKLSDIKPENAIAISRGIPDFTDPLTGSKCFLISAGRCGGMIPLGTKLPDGKPHPLAGKGFLLAEHRAYYQDRSDNLPGGCELMSKRDIEWDGLDLTLGEPEWLEIDDIGRLLYSGMNTTPYGDGFLMCFSTHPSDNRPEYCDYNPNSSAKAGAFTAVIGYDGGKWGIRETGPIFAAGLDATECCLRPYNGGYLASVRRTSSPVVTLYFSTDGLNFVKHFETWNHTVPRMLNQGLDGSLYLATNTGPEWLRNPLMCYPWNGEGFDEPFAAHDENGIHDCNAPDSIPFVDHGIAYNVTLEGRKRHFMTYRVCELVERTAYGFQGSLKELIESKGGPLPLRDTTGMYLVEFEY